MHAGSLGVVARLHCPVPWHHGHGTLIWPPSRFANTRPVARQAEHGCGPPVSSGASLFAGRRLRAGAVVSAMGVILDHRGARHAPPRLAAVGSPRGCRRPFRPLPSSDLHLGNLRTALLAWLGARSQGSPFHLRIDDLDAGRSRADIAERQLADLARLGLGHDGPVPRQSERLARYEAAFEVLRAGEHVYPCFCTRAEIRDAARAPHGAPTGSYPGTCRDLTVDERAARERDGRRPAWRLRATGHQLPFTDLVLGEQNVASEDVVVRRADGEFGYQLAVVLDDADQDIDEVVRGADLLPSVGTQRELQRLLDLPPVRYAHVALMLGPDGERLAKRHGAATLSDALAGRAGIVLPGLQPETAAEVEAVRGALAATVGLTEPGSAPTLDELVDRFAYERLPAQSTMMQGC